MAIATDSAAAGPDPSLLKKMVGAGEVPEIAAFAMVHDQQQRGASSLLNVQPESGGVFLTLERQLFFGGYR